MAAKNKLQSKIFCIRHKNADKERTLSRAAIIRNKIRPRMRCIMKHDNLIHQDSTPQLSLSPSANKEKIPKKKVGGCFFFLFTNCPPITVSMRSALALKLPIHPIPPTRLEGGLTVLLKKESDTKQSNTSEASPHAPTMSRPGGI